MADLTITFLGTGTSQGIPMVGCDCRVCHSEDPRDKRSRASIYVETPEAQFVIDTGPDFRNQCLRENLRHLDAAVYTHSHTDHVMGFDDLRPFCFSGKRIPIYASPETMADLKRVFAFAFENEKYTPGYVNPIPFTITSPFQLGETTLTPLAIVHGRTPVNGYLFEREGQRLAAYLSDCKALKEGMEEKIHGVKLLIVDALRYTPHSTHMNVEEALAMVDRVKPEATLFTHLCHDLSHAETEATLPDGVRIAYDGLKVVV